VRLHITSSARHAEQAHYVRGSACRNRVVTDLDANLSGKSLNVSAVRSITGQDFINVSQISTKASASISCGSNNLPDVRQTNDCKQVAVFRRLAVIPMTADATSLCVTRVPTESRQRGLCYIVCVCEIQVLSVDACDATNGLDVGSRYNFYSELFELG